MADTFQLQVATPEKLLIDEQVTLAEIPGKNGYMGILAGHAPLLSALDPGILSYEGGGGPHKIVVAGGFVEVFDNHVRVLADSAEFTNEVRADEARKQLEEANELLRKADSEQATEIAVTEMKKAQARLDAGDRGSH